MINKRGITISMLATIIIILIIITTTIVFSVNNVTDAATLRTFATEINMVRDEVKVRQSKSTDTSYMKETVFLDVSGITQSIVDEQFAGENIVTNNIALYKLDLNILGLSSTVYGKHISNGDSYPATDIYAISTTTGKIYYCEGIKANGTTYYTLIDELESLIGNKVETKNTTKQVVFKPSKIGWTNEAITAEIKVPVEYTGVTVATNLTGNNSENVGEQTVVDNITVVPVNIANKKANYTITVNYIKEGNNVTETFEVNNYDGTNPQLVSAGTQSSKRNGQILNSYLENIQFTDSLSGIKRVRYVKNVASISLTQSELRTYINEVGTDLKGNSMVWENDANYYLFYVEDNAGNMYVISEEASADILNARIVNGFNIIKGVNRPVILEGMTPIVYDATSATGDCWRDATENEIKFDTWYDYSESSKKWANARTEDGSLWVWIPRYEYDIVEEPGTVLKAEYGTINIRFISKGVNASTNGYTTNSDGVVTSSDGYTIHPAFVNETSCGYVNGGWDEDVAGIWVAKFETSMLNQNQQNVNTSTKALGNVPISANAVPQAKAGNMSWRYINIANAYYNSLEYAAIVSAGDTTLDATYDSHLIKNSEWGMVAYLAISKYGYGIEKIQRNSDTSYYTGGSNDLSVVYGLNRNQTTTGNVYGIYDMAGCSMERVATYYKFYDYTTNLSNYYTDETLSGRTFCFQNGSSTKYSTVYENSSGSNAPDSENCKTGDALYEVATNAIRQAWYSSQSYVCYSASPVLMRGGTKTTGKILTSNMNNGAGVATIGYRTVLINK